MASLPELPAVTSLSKYVTRVLGQNPSKFTLQGTNSYLVHHPHSSRLILIDTTGPSSSASLSPTALETYLSSLRSILVNQQPDKPARHVSDVILTHWHRDHTDALVHVLRSLTSTDNASRQGRGPSPPPPIRVWKFPCASTTTSADETTAWKSEHGRDAALERELTDVPSDVLEAAKADPAGGRIHRLRHGQRFRLAADDVGSSSSQQQTEKDDSAIELEVVHTPGHTSDSICLVLRAIPPPPSSSASDPAAPPLGVFTADTVLGHGTAVFASLSAYLASLTSLISTLSSSSTATDPQHDLSLIPLFPGHGAVVEDGLGKIKEYRAHRLERERQVVLALKKAHTAEGRAHEGGEGGSTLTADELVDQIYGTTIPSSLKPAATHGCLLHLAKLLEEGIVKRHARPRPNSSHAQPVPALPKEGKEGDEHEEVQIPEGWYDGWSIA
ncbi:hypothetical protein JCM10908_004425 [Rhodotorula pacifica]|uniref:uncharacterized protein n=1 Tax=Rhodotorula pacifica TaxID=1495444 RepID=UPI003170AB25